MKKLVQLMMKSRFLFNLNRAICILLLIALHIAFSAHFSFAQVKPQLAFTSDTQEPMWIETLFLKSNHNLEATKMIFRDVNRIHPSALFILGDVVSLGKNARAWKNMDGYLKTTIQDSIPVYATLGNHEVMFNSQKGTAFFRKRFPMYNPAGYVKIVDSVAVILLNSNFGIMKASEISDQNTWYKLELKALDQNAAVKFIIVGCHHSPFTNSKIVKASTGVQQNFIPPFIASQKCVLFLSGHSHNFEQFSYQKKCFLVIGGGGGLHQPLNANNSEMHDLSANYKPAFHYLLIRRDQNELHILSRQLKNDFSGFTDGLKSTVK